jgi:hypothetical protein
VDNSRVYTLLDMDFIAIGDTTVDEFIRLKEAEVHCGLNRRTALSL